ncbi:MAG: OadG family protein [Kiritimatiellaeota bacterium]|nr:OadG family protein [Kiritimatiellota bacterium]
MHNELWARTWQVVSLGMLSTFAFLAALVFCLKLMRAWVRRGDADKTEAGK